MPQIAIRRDKIPLWTGADGALVLNANVSSLTAPLNPGDVPIVDAEFALDAAPQLLLGEPQVLTVTIKAGTKLKLTPAWKEQMGTASVLIERFKLNDLLTDENLLLTFELGANASVAAQGSFGYGILNVGASVEGGGNAAIVQVRPYPRSTGFLAMVQDFFGHLALPVNLKSPPLPGEVTSFEYGGYLNFGVNASAGYEIKGTNQFSIGNLKLSEHCQLAVVGKLGISGNVAGRFSIEVRSGESTGWARVVVRRASTHQFSFAADASVVASLNTEGMPRSGKEFLGALLGVQAKNWLNLIDSAVGLAGKIPSLDNLMNRLDGLGGDFMEQWIGKPISQLRPSEFQAFQTRLKIVAESYRSLDNSAISLFDRYFDPVLNRIDLLTRHLEDLSKMTAWDQLKGEIDPTLWNIIRQLTDGDPLGWVLGRLATETTEPAATLNLFQKRIKDALSLIRDQTYAEIRNVIQIANEHFDVERYLKALEAIDSPDHLKNTASHQLKNFVSRLLGRSLDSLNPKDLKVAFDIVQQVAKARESLWNTFDQKIKDAAQQNLSLSLHKEFNRSDERTALIDLEVKLLDEATGVPNLTGQRLMRAAGRGDFRELLTNYQPDIVRLHEGSLTHQLSRQSLLRINIAGWHREFNYEEMHRVIVNSEQQIRTSSAGQLTVFTKVDMNAESERRRHGRSKSEETMHTNFLLRFLGETHQILKDSQLEKQDLQYLVDVVTGQSASYDVTFTDKDTSPAELAEYLVFARDLGLDAVGATAQGLTPYLKLDQGSYGPISAVYEVRYTESGLRNLFSQATNEKQIRQILRKIVLANYAGQGRIAEVAWLYNSDDVKQLWDTNRNNFIDADSILGNAQIRVASPIQGIQPGTISNSRFNRILVAGLFMIEDDLVKAFSKLQKLLSSNRPIPIKQFEDTLADFGSVLNRFDQRDLGDNSVFAVFDGLIRLHSPVQEARSSALRLTSQRDGQERTMIFILRCGEAQPSSSESAGPPRVVGAGK